MTAVPYTNPKRKRGILFKTSLALRVSVRIALPVNVRASNINGAARTVGFAPHRFGFASGEMYHASATP
jgi:hypothetical protein